jgi:hypothetical protein
VGPDYILWFGCILLGIFIGWVAPVTSWYAIRRGALLGVGSWGIGILIGSAPEFAADVLWALITLDKKYGPVFGIIEYPIIAIGYSLILAALLISFRRALARTSSNRTVERDARKNGARPTP